MIKVVGKGVENRLKVVLDKLITKSRNVFVVGRKNLNPELIANECLDRKVKNQIQDVICKLDIEKTSDRVNCKLGSMDTPLLFKYPYLIYIHTGYSCMHAPIFL